MTDQTLKKQKGNIELSTQRRGGEGVLKISHLFADFIILNNRSVVHFCGWWKWEGHFCRSYKWVTSKTIIKK